jgi:hypothetical protein
MLSGCPHLCSGLAAHACVSALVSAAASPHVTTVTYDKIMNLVTSTLNCRYIPIHNRACVLFVLYEMQSPACSRRGHAAVAHRFAVFSEVPQHALSPSSFSSDCNYFSLKLHSTAFMSPFI